MALSRAGARALCSIGTAIVVADELACAARGTLCSRPPTHDNAVARPWLHLSTVRPAASSLAELIREPVERRSIAVDMARSFRCIASLANNEAVLVLITVMCRNPFSESLKPSNFMKTFRTRHSA